VWAAVVSADVLKVRRFGVTVLDVDQVSEHEDTCVARVPIFRGLTPAQQHEVAGFARPVRAPKGSLLQAAGAEQKRLVVLHSGRIRLVHVLENGREQVVRVAEPGDAVGETSFLLGRRPEHFAYADADVTLCTFDHADLARLVASYPPIAVRMLQVATERLLSAERMLAAFASTDVRVSIRQQGLQALLQSTVGGALARHQVDKTGRDPGDFGVNGDQVGQKLLAAKRAQGVCALKLCQMQSHKTAYGQKRMEVEKKRAKRR
jgi:CRP-like cAMP-binding protein